MIGTTELKKYIESVDLDRMVKEKESIEYEFKKFMDLNYFDTYQDYPHKLNILWHDAHQDRFIEILIKNSQEGVPTTKKNSPKFLKHFVLPKIPKG